MIIREWRGRAPATNSEAYPRHFRKEVIPELLKLKGFLGAELCRRPLRGAVEFLVLTRWASLDAIRAFAGDEIDRAVVEPGAAAALIDYDPKV